jgi:hypothetical protein
MDRIIYESDGELHIFHNDVRRPNFSRHHLKIDTVADFKATLRAGPYAWPGGYQMAFFTFDAEKLCFDCARKEARQIIHAIQHELMDQWTVIGSEVIYEGRDPCSHCNKPIVGAYEPDQPETAA